MLLQSALGARRGHFFPFQAGKCCAAEDHASQIRALCAGMPVFIISLRRLFLSKGLLPYYYKKRERTDAIDILQILLSERLMAWALETRMTALDEGR